MYVGFTITYLGLALKNPLVPSSTPLSHDLDAVLHLEDAGAAAIGVVMLAASFIVAAICAQKDLRLQQ